ncbi:heavy-metal-associated domain-containing protein [Acetobacter conturbans]|uniref:Heavy metal transporter n=1 Tax=Acetobacter conturbans TaxID=1737472 RepID=A0ABX0JYT0_9PROT|nr:heavy-metal-associated domain-containing protein [Acetobacter conturbans]NHN88496.1 heavy metal transporter [Acetobacter conturbans]
MTTTTLIVQGMTCDGCVTAVKRALEGIPGVKEATPSLEKGAVKVDYDPSETSPSSFTPSLEAAGFEVLS